MSQEGKFCLTNLMFISSGARTCEPVQVKRATSEQTRKCACMHAVRQVDENQSGERDVTCLNESGFGVILILFSLCIFLALRSHHKVSTKNLNLS